MWCDNRNTQLVVYCHFTAISYYGKIFHRGQFSNIFFPACAAGSRTLPHMVTESELNLWDIVQVKTFSGKSSVLSTIVAALSSSPTKTSCQQSLTAGQRWRENQLHSDASSASRSSGYQCTSRLRHQIAPTASNDRDGYKLAFQIASALTLNGPSPKLKGLSFCTGHARRLLAAGLSNCSATRHRGMAKAIPSHSKP